MGKRKICSLRIREAAKKVIFLMEVQLRWGGGVKGKMPLRKDLCTRLLLAFSIKLYLFLKCKMVIKCSFFPPTMQPPKT